jgi:CCR4-NOT transcription complex subunit 3
MFALPSALAEYLAETAADEAALGARYGEASGRFGFESSDATAIAAPDAGVGVLLGGVSHHDPAVHLRLLEASHRNAPRPGDGDWSRRVPSSWTGAAAAPSSYPTTSPPVLENPALFERLDADALFFTFYYQQGSARQYLAARELKRANWRFHKKHATWFARQEEPKTSTETHERGSYIYFDFSSDAPSAGAGAGAGAASGWCQRSKPDFVFHYSQLESELV